MNKDKLETIREKFFAFIESTPTRRIWDYEKQQIWDYIVTNLLQGEAMDGAGEAEAEALLTMMFMGNHETYIRKAVIQAMVAFRNMKEIFTETNPQSSPPASSGNDIEQEPRFVYMADLIGLQRKYIQLLSNEITDMFGIAQAHGWKSKQVADGERIRAEIKGFETLLKADSSNTDSPQINDSPIEP